MLCPTAHWQVGEADKALRRTRDILEQKSVPSDRRSTSASRLQVNPQIMTQPSTVTLDGQ
jgi:hypothetical protein